MSPLCYDIDMMFGTKCLVGVKFRWHRPAIMTNSLIAAGVLGWAGLGWVVQSDMAGSSPDQILTVINTYQDSSQSDH